MVTCGGAPVARTAAVDSMWTMAKSIGEIVVPRSSATSACRLPATTRERRDNEMPGVHYHFLGRDDFMRLRETRGLLEWAEVHGNLYGTPIDQVRGILAAGRDAILTIDPQGARQVRVAVPDALLVFVKPPTMEDLAERLRGRGSESAQSLARRRRDAEHWMADTDDYDHVVVNETGHPEEAAERIWEIIQSEARREPPRRPRI